MTLTDGFVERALSLKSQIKFPSAVTAQGFDERTDGRRESAAQMQGLRKLKHFRNKAEVATADIRRHGDASLAESSTFGSLYNFSPLRCFHLTTVVSGKWYSVYATERKKKRKKENCNLSLNVERLAARIAQVCEHLIAQYLKLSHLRGRDG